MQNLRAHYLMLQLFVNYGGAGTWHVDSYKCVSDVQHS